MIISEQQIMKLMDYSHAHLARLCQEHAPIQAIQDLAELVSEIANQQSQELKTVE